MDNTTITQAQFPERVQKKNFVKNLNVDVLLIIFDNVRKGNKRDTAKGSPGNLVPAMLACKSWWEIIVNSPILWQDIQVRSDNAMAKILEMVRTTSLDTANTRKSTGISFEALRSLKIKHARDRIRGLLASALDLPSVMLEELVLEVDETPKDKRKGVQRSTPVDLPENFFTGARLTRLGLNGVNLPITSNLLRSPNLKHLSLEYLSASARFSWIQMTSLLEALPGLVTLNLTGAFNGNDNINYPIHQQKPITLPCVKSISIVPDTVQDLNNFFGIVSYSCVDYLKFGTLDEAANNSNDIFLAVKNVFRACTERDLSHDVGVLMIDERKNKGVSRLQLERPVVRGFGTAACRGFYLDVDFSSSVETREDTINGVLLALNLQNVTHLARGAGLTRSLLESHFAHLPMLEYVSLSGPRPSVSAFVDILQSPMVNPFSALKKIEIRRGAARRGDPVKSSERDAVSAMRREVQEIRLQRNTMIGLRFAELRKVSRHEIFARM